MYLIPFLSPCLEEFLDCLPLALDWDRDCEAREADLDQIENRLAPDSRRDSDSFVRQEPAERKQSMGAQDQRR